MGSSTSPPPALQRAPGRSRSRTRYIGDHKLHSCMCACRLAILMADTTTKNTVPHIFGFWGCKDCCMLSLFLAYNNRCLPTSCFIFNEHTLWLRSSYRKKMSWTSVKIIKNEVGCRDDTVPKTVETRRHCEEDWEHATIFRNPLPTSLVFGGCGRLLHALNPPRSAFLFQQFLARCHPYILLHF